MTEWAPECFIDKSLIHSERLMNYIMFVLNSVFTGGLSNYMEFFSAKLKSKIDTLGQFLAPLVGILKNLYLGVNNLGVLNN